ncbi:UNVERIFIED_CONTAM: putative gamma-glutamylcyclotransferase [Sesamum radiatum]|uniref:Gamma-glutamylcyclotransferase family protein n=1 Tax=Sesamum radiatum TaxID=300843 RepID=A0AAW2TF08_SESRA
MGAEAAVTQPAVVFTYGTLKQGFSNHILLQDMIATGDATFLGSCRTLHPLPLVCGPYRVPFLLNLPAAANASR